MADKERLEEGLVLESNGAAACPSTTAAMISSTSTTGSSNQATTNGKPLEVRSPSGPNVDRETGILAVATSSDLDEDEFELMEYDAASIESGSVTSSIMKHEYEHGRRYHHYRHGRYVLPNDDVEQNREHMKHVMHLECADGALYNAPIGDHPQRILDLGTGTGLWAIDVAERFPSAEVVGLDLSPIQPDWIPPNLKFMVDDIEDDWVEGDIYDFIHMRHTSTYLKDMDRLLRNCFENLVPGGWFEVSDFGGILYSDDGTMPENYPVSQFLDLVAEALRHVGGDMFLPLKEQEKLERAGFVNIRCRVVKLPIGTWPKDKIQRLIGMYFREALFSFVAAMRAKAFRSLNVSDNELELFLVGVRKALQDTSIHSYIHYVSWWAQKP